MFRAAIMSGIVSVLVASAMLMSGCAAAQKDVDKAFEISDDLGRERRTKIMGREVIVHPEADNKISIPF